MCRTNVFTCPHWLQVLFWVLCMSVNGCMVPASMQSQFFVTVWHLCISAEMHRRECACFLSERKNYVSVSEVQKPCNEGKKTWMFPPCGCDKNTSVAQLSVWNWIPRWWRQSKAPTLLCERQLRHQLVQPPETSQKGREKTSGEKPHLLTLLRLWKLWLIGSSNHCKTSD